ncbi:MAG TPA: hypothetical protein VEZ11_12090 [Thermoanaerobaculia bacterium]|nr:hypothetical protein [Thermoanaerobaculia bacterium]
MTHSSATLSATGLSWDEAIALYELARVYVRRSWLEAISAPAAAGRRLRLPRRPGVAVGISGGRRFGLSARVREENGWTRLVLSELRARFGVLDYEIVGDVHARAGREEMPRDGGRVQAAGCLVRKSGVEEPMLLTAAHVIGSEGTSIPLRRAGNEVDAGIVALGSDGHFEPVAVPRQRLLGIRRKPLETGETVFATNREGIEKRGRISLPMTDVEIRHGQAELREFSRQIEIMGEPAPFCADGDSGAIVYDGERRAIGLLAGGSVSRSYASPIRRVLERLGVELVLD